MAWSISFRSAVVWGEYMGGLEVGGQGSEIRNLEIKTGGPCTLLLNSFLVIGKVHQPIQLGWICHLDFKKPASALGRLVG